MRGVFGRRFSVEGSAFLGKLLGIATVKSRDSCLIICVSFVLKIISHWLANICLVIHAFLDFFLDLNNLGTNALAFKINVNGPGKTLFITLNVGVLTCFAYSDNWDRSLQIKEKLALSGLIPLN